ncbi:MAG TPA: glycosyltransferase [Solirubrobacterales bacterium]|nr:glycosyltransferase [Solirubrobacterales bacterium]
MTDNRIRVLTMVESIGYATGGAERIAVAIASRLDPDRFHSSLCVTRWDEEGAARDDVARAVADVEAAGVTLRKVHRSSRYDFAAWRPIIPVLRTGTDVLHSHMFGSNSWGAILGRLCRVPVIVAHEHMWSFDGSRSRHFLDRDLIGRGCDLFLTVSEQSRRSMIELEGVNPSKLEALRNGIPDRPAGDGARIRKDLGIGSDEPVVGSVGLLREEKAFEVLVEAAKVLAEEDRTFRLLIVGDGPERDKIERAITTFELSGKVILTGMRQDVPDLLAAMDVAVCSSDWEGGPLSILEYMQAGLPVVATEVGGIPEMVTDGVTGRLVPKRDPTAMAEAIGTLLDDPDEAARLGKAGGERQRTEYRLKTMVERVEERYEELFAASSRR